MEFKVMGNRYDFKVLTEEEQDEIIVEFLEAQERDLFSHTINLDRFERMLRKLPNGPWRERIEELKRQTQERLMEVASIIEATLPQLPPPERIRAAKQRLLARRNLERSRPYA